MQAAGEGPTSTPPHPKETRSHLYFRHTAYIYKESIRILVSHYFFIHNSNMLSIRRPLNVMFL